MWGKGVERNLRTIILITSGGAKRQEPLITKEAKKCSLSMDWSKVAARDKRVLMQFGCDLKS